MAHVDLCPYETRPVQVLVAGAGHDGHLKAYRSDRDGVVGLGPVVGQGG